MKRRFNRRFEKDRTPSRAVVEQFRATFTGLKEEKGGEDEENSGLGLVHYRGRREEFDLGVEYSQKADALDRAVGGEDPRRVGLGG